MKLCERCGKEMKWKTRKLCPSCNNSLWRKIRVYKLKMLYGGKCAICGYDKCIDAMDFHHRDSTEKDFSIREMRSASWDKLIEETKKCDLLCSNCHREIHVDEFYVGKNLDDLTI